MIKDIYDTNLTSVWTSGSIPSEFSITLGLHQGTLTPYFFAFVFFYFFFPLDDIVLVDESSHGISVKLEIWWDALKSKIFGWVGLKQRTWNDGM